MSCLILRQLLFASLPCTLEMLLDARLRGIKDILASAKASDFGSPLTNYIALVPSGDFEE